MYKTLVNNGINYQPQLVNAGFQPSTVVSAMRWAFESSVKRFLFLIFNTPPPPQKKKHSKSPESLLPKSLSFFFHIYIGIFYGFLQHFCRFGSNINSSLVASVPPAIGNNFDLKMGIPHVTGCFKKRILNNWMMI